MIRISEKEKCVGCHACYNICPTHSISMQIDVDGFWYPVVDIEKCIHCGRCEKVCPVLKQAKRNEEQLQIYGACSVDEDIRFQSSSGGVFSVLALHVLNKGGIVYGASFNSNFQVQHIGISSVTELDKLRGSKYVQSQIGDIYRDVKQQLRNGKMVLFTGTPCQVDGLNNFLGRTYDNLITQDIVCHGVPSPMVWEKYLRFQEKISHSKPIHISFRDKAHGWKKYAVTIDYENGKRASCICWQDLMMRAFLKDICLRPSCYACPSKGVHRSSDITLADFWNIDHVIPKMDDDKGVSLVLCHTLKGERLFSEVKDKLNYHEMDITAIAGNIPMCRPAKKPSKYDSFMAEIKTKPFDIIVNKYCYTPLYDRVKNRLKRMFK